MKDTKLLVCEGACNPGLGQLDEQRRAVARHLNEFTGTMPAMSHEWVDAARQLVHRPHHREAPGFMSNIWTCTVCGATRRW